MTQRRSNWTNLQTYLGLNEGAGEEMGQRLYGDVANQANQANQRIGSAETEFGYRSSGGRLSGPDANAGNQSANMYTADQARQRASQGYTGPNSLSDVDQNLSGQVADAVARVQNAQSQAGIGQELQKTYGAQAASGAGGSALDAFLTGTASSSSLSGLKDQYGGLMENLGVADERAAKKAQEGQKVSAASAEKWAALTPKLEDEARRQLVAKAAGERAHKQQLYEIALQQEQQYGRGNTRGGREAHYEDPRLRAAREGRLTEYDAEQRAQHGGQPAEWEGKADYDPTKNVPAYWDPNYWEGAERGAPEPVGAEKERQLQAHRRRYSGL